MHEIRIKKQIPISFSSPQYIVMAEESHITKIFTQNNANYMFKKRFVAQSDLIYQAIFIHLINTCLLIFIINNTSILIPILRDNQIL